MHNFRWSDEDQTHVDQAFSAQANLRKHQRGVNASYLKQMITALRPGTTVPAAKLARMELLAQCVLHLDLEPFEPNRKGMKKPSLPTACLRDAAKAWCEYHPMEKKEMLRGLRDRSRGVPCLLGAYGQPCGRARQQHITRTPAGNKTNFASTS